MKVSLVRNGFWSLAALLALNACGIKPSELQFDDSTVNRQLASTNDLDIAAPVSNRSYVESSLNQVFGLTTPSLFQTTASSGNVLKMESGVYRMKEFGGACDRYAASESASGTATFEFPREQCYAGIGVVQLTNSNPQRYSYTTKMCEDLVNDTTQFNMAMAKLFSNFASSQPKPDSSGITKVYQLFYPTEKPSDELLLSLQSMSSQSGSDSEAWKRIFVTFCVSPEWQLF